jgi:hypothetical protein
MKPTFYRLSCALTGEDRLDEQLSEEFEARLRAHYPGSLKTLLEAFDKQEPETPPDKAVVAALGADASLHLIAREILRIWYTGQFETPFEGIDAPRTSRQWESGLMWKVIHAPAPGFSKNQYGVWATKPD